MKPIPDPFTSPPQLDPSDAFKKHVRALLGDKVRETVAVMTPAAWTQSVLDATVLARGCKACGCDVWLSPSSRELLGRDDVVFVCLRCAVPGSEAVFGK